MFCSYAKFYNNMLVTEAAGNAQSLDRAWVTSNAIFSHFIFGEKHKLWMDSTKKVFDISLWFFLQVKVRNDYFKTFQGFVDIQFISWPKVMKKMNFPRKNETFYKKCRILKTLPFIKKRLNGFGGLLYRNHFPKQKRKSSAAFRSWIQKCGKTCFSQNAKTMSCDYKL